MNKAIEQILRNQQVLLESKLGYSADEELNEQLTRTLKVLEDDNCTKSESEKKA